MIFFFHKIYSSYSCLSLSSSPQLPLLQIHSYSVSSSESRKPLREKRQKKYKIRYNKTRQNPSYLAGQGNPIGGKGPKGRQKSQRHPCSHSNESHRNTKLTAIRHTQRTCWRPMLVHACPIGFLLSWFSRPCSPGDLCALSLWQSLLPLIHEVPQLIGEGPDEHLLFRFSLCIMSSCGYLFPLPCADLGNLSYN